MLCPFCNCELRTVLRKGIESDHCPCCGGKWFSRGEMDKLMREKPVPRSERETILDVPSEEDRSWSREIDYYDFG